MGPEKVFARPAADNEALLAERVTVNSIVQDVADAVEAWKIALDDGYWRALLLQRGLVPTAGRLCGGQSLPSIGTIVPKRPMRPLSTARGHLGGKDPVPALSRWWRSCSRRCRSTLPHDAIELAQVVGSFPGVRSKPILFRRGPTGAGRTARARRSPKRATSMWAKFFSKSSAPSS